MLGLWPVSGAQIVWTLKNGGMKEIEVQGRLKFRFRFKFKCSVVSFRVRTMS